MSEQVTSDICRELREKIYGMIFPRWILMSIGGAFILALVLLYTVSGSNKVAASEAQKKAEIVEARVSVEIEYLKSGQQRIEGELQAQRRILTRIDRRINGG